MSSKKRKVEIADEKESKFNEFVQNLESVELVEKYIEILTNRQEHLKQLCENKTIQDEIDEYGFVVRVGQQPDIVGLHKFILPYHVQVSTTSRLKENPAETATVDESATKQPDWVKYTGFEEQTKNEHGWTYHWDKINLSEKMEFDDITDEWDYGDHDSPIIGLGSIDMTFYFAAQPYPDKTKAFSLLGAHGQVQDFGVGEFNETEDEWKEHEPRYVMYKKT